MKNKRIINSWDKIEPDSVADARMLDAVLARNHSSEKRKGSSMNKALNWRRLAPVAACLIMVVAITAVFGNNAGWFDGKIYTAETGGGTLNFYKSASSSASSLDFGVDVTSRDLTAEENNKLFGNLSVTSHGNFSETGKTLLHVEGRTGNTKIILAAHGIPVTDTVIETSRRISEVNGIQVSAGYFITHENSRGVKNIIYLASFDMNGVQVYVECGGSENMGGEWKSEIASVIDTLTKSNIPDLCAIIE